jgi:hypothetical protein
MSIASCGARSRRQPNRCCSATAAASHYRLRAFAALANRAHWTQPCPMPLLRWRVADTSALFQPAAVRVRIVPFNVPSPAHRRVAQLSWVTLRPYPAHRSTVCFNFQLLAGAEPCLPRKPCCAEVTCQPLKTGLARMAAVANVMLARTDEVIE